MESLLSQPTTLIEIGVVAVIIFFQFIVFGQNTAGIRRLKKLYPPAAALESEAVSVSTTTGESHSQTLIASAKGYSKTFRSIVDNSNAYLKRNQGEAELEVLEQIASDQDYTLERSLERTVDLPLYIGLFCTFLGVILGLSALFFNPQGVANDAAIQSFIGGVFIAMVGSAIGLVLSVRGKYLLKNALEKRDQGQYGYLTFLREHIIKPLRVKPETEKDPGAAALRETLGAFHEGFTSYQEGVNTSLQETVDVLGQLKGALEKVRGLETGFERLGQSMEQNDRLIDKQVGFIDNYTRKAESFANILGNRFETVDNKLQELTAEGISQVENSAQAAYAKLDAYLASLQDPEAGQAFVDDMRKDVQALRGQLVSLQQQSVDINRQMLARIDQDEQVNVRISQQMEAMNAQMKAFLTAQEEAKNGFTNSFAFKAFAVTGILAFLSVLAVAAKYLIPGL